MRIEELSIGDWVTYDKCSDPVQILGVDSRNGKCVVMTDSCYSDGVIGFIDNVHPIPLTPEILEKNGFEFKRENIAFEDYVTNLENGKILLLGVIGGGKYYLMYETKGERITTKGCNGLV